MFWSRRNTTWVTDDRGVKHPRAVAPRREDLRADVVRRRAAVWRSAFGSGKKGVNWNFVGWFVPFVAMNGVGVAWAQSAFGLPAGLAWGVLFAGAIGVGVSLGRVVKEDVVEAARRSALIAVEEGACGVCWYDLRALKVEEDGCVVCPECRAAWLAMRVNADAGDAAPSGGSAPLMPLLGGVVPIRDQRARLYALVSTGELRRRARAASELEQRRINDAIAVIGKQGEVSRVLVVFVLATLGVLALGRAIQQHPFLGGTFDLWIDWIFRVFTGVAFLVAAGVWLIRRGGDGEKAVRTLLMRALCPGCGKSLEAEQIDAAGNRQCPSCRGVWATPWRKSYFECPHCKRGPEGIYTNAQGRVVCSECGNLIEG